MYVAGPIHHIQQLHPVFQHDGYLRFSANPDDQDDKSFSLIVCEKGNWKKCGKEQMYICKGFGALMKVINVLCRK